MLGQKIDQDESNSLKGRYQKNNPGKTKGVIFDRATFESVLSHREAHYVAVFFGETEEGINTVVISGLDKNRQEILASTMNRGGPCPPYC
jgi:hypothetical protein